jgi:hypothetical protein
MCASAHIPDVPGVSSDALKRPAGGGCKVSTLAFGKVFPLPAIPVYVFPI